MREGSAVRKRAKVRTWVLFVYAAPLFILACGKTGIEEDDYAQAIIDVVCDRAQSCCESSGMDLADECVIWAEAWLVGSRVDNTVFDSKAAERCVQAIEGSSCAFDDASDLQVCQEVYTGVLGPGRACMSSIQCARPALGVAYCESGRCVQVRHHPEGDACGIDRRDDGTIVDHGPCATGFMCNSNSTCEKPRDIGANCVQLSECRSDLLCTEGICAAVQEEDPCGNESGCPGPLRCSVEVNPGEDGVCFRPGEPGEACGAPQECLSHVCTDGVCRAVVPSYCP